MQFFIWLAFLGVIGVIIFAIQNSTAPVIMIQFLFWKWEISLIYATLGAVGSGMLIIIPLWIRSAIKASLRIRNLKKEIKVLEREMRHQVEVSKPEEPEEGK
jgi:uncharacterized integral membrane protein